MTFQHLNPEFIDIGDVTDGKIPTFYYDKKQKPASEIFRNAGLIAKYVPTKVGRHFMPVCANKWPCANLFHKKTLIIFYFQDY